MKIKLHKRILWRLQSFARKTLYRVGLGRKTHEGHLECADLFPHDGAFSNDACRFTVTAGHYWINGETLVVPEGETRIYELTKDKRQWVLLS